MNKAKKISTYSIMTRNLIFIISMITLVLGLLIVISVGHELLEQQSISSNNILTSLEKSHIENNQDWRDWRKDSSLDTSSSYAIIKSKKNTYYSESTKKILQTNPQKIPFFQNIYFADDFGFFYHSIKTEKHTKYELWQNLDDQLSILVRVVEVTLLLLLLTLIISPIYIRWLARRLTQPIITLADESAISQTTHSTDLQLTVPDNPAEINQLANNFNALLAELTLRENQQQIFLMNATHELKTPIATIYSHAQLIQRHGKSHPETIEKSINYIENEAQHMSTLVNELLTLTRIDQISYTKKRFDLVPALMEQITKFQTTFSQTIQTSIPEYALLDSNQEIVEQIIEGLMSNAAKFSPQDSTITITVTPQAEHFVISVMDEGVGISDDDKQHIFERFYRSDETRGSISGTGLGLAIAKELANNINATLAVTDNHPTGTIFSLTI